MKDLINIRDVEDIQKLDNEYDLQKALLFERKLRLLMEEDTSLKPIRKNLRKLIEAYETKNWSNSQLITDEQISEAEEAEVLVEAERKFIQKRKETIRKKLRSFDMNQQDLGELLGHKKSYISELINGVSQFSMKDLVIIHRVLKIDLFLLIPTFLQTETREKIKQSITKLNNPKLKLRKKDLITS